MIDWLEQHLLTCYFKSHLGIECPGCGMQRAFIALLRGDLYQSLAYHPALIPFLITLVVLIIHLFVKHPKGGTLIMWMFIGTSAITIVQYIVKQVFFIQHLH